MQNGQIISNERLQNDYFLVRFHAPEICRKARADTARRPPTF